MAPETYDPTYPCPKCGRMLRPEGEVTISATTDARPPLPVYSCDECIMVSKVFDEEMELPLSFCVDKEGRPFDPASPDGELRF